MDVLTLTIIMILAIVLQSAACFAQYRVDKASSGPGWWALGSACLALGFLFHVLRGNPSLGQVAIVANNVLYFSGLALLHVGVLRFFDLVERRAALASSGAVFFALTTYFTYGDDNIGVRRILMSLAVAALSFLIARTLYIHKTRQVLDSARLLAAVFLLNGCFFVFRASTPLFVATSADMFAPTILNTLTYLDIFIASTLWTFGFIVMVNQRLNAESREAREHFELIFNTSPDAVLVTRLKDGIIVDINDGFTVLTGYGREEVIGRSTFEVNIWGNQSDRRKVVAELTERGGCENLEMVFLHKDGSQIIGILSAKTVMLHGLPHMLSVTRDITLRKQLEVRLQEREEHYRLLTEDVSDVVWKMDRNYHFTYISPADERMRGYRADEVIGHHVFEFMTDAGIALIKGKTGQRNRAVKKGETRISQLTFQVQQLCKDGSLVWTEIHSTVERDAAGRVTGYHGITRNIAERKMAEQTLQDSEYRWKFAVEGSGDGVLDWNVQTDELKYSKRWKEMLGYGEDEILPVKQEWIDRIHPDDRAHVSSAMQGYLDGKVQTYVAEFRLKCKDGSYKWILARGMIVERSRSGRPLRMIGTHTDITGLKITEQALEESNRKLAALSLTDGLTGIANRRHFDDTLLHEQARHVRSGAELSLILLDIDYFKLFNDNYGHVNGDECLRRIARVIANCATRPADLAARYGGEEFACILPETDLNGAIMIAEQIRRGIQALAIPHKGSTVAEHVTASLGVVTVLCKQGDTVENLLAQVDNLLYRAKSSGRNRLEFIAPLYGSAASLPEDKGNLVQLVWKDSFCCGNRLIDSQHRSLLHITNQMLEAVFSGCAPSEISSLISLLLGHVSQHFHDEQIIMESAGFPGISQHVAEHARLLARGMELSEQFKAATLSVGDVFQFLAYDVVMIHMLGADREYLPYICDQAGANGAGQEDTDMKRSGGTQTFSEESRI